MPATVGVSRCRDMKTQWLDKKIHNDGFGFPVTKRLQIYIAVFSMKIGRNCSPSNFRGKAFGLAVGYIWGLGGPAVQKSSSVSNL